MWWVLPFSCGIDSEIEFAVRGRHEQSWCERFPTSEQCVDTSIEEPFEPLPQNEDPEDFLPEDTSCNTPMYIRKILPLFGETAPINTHPIVLTIGNGDHTHMHVELQLGNQPVPHEQEVTCYIHEGEEEFHCTYLLFPLENLQPNTEYVVSVTSIDPHPVPGERFDSVFRTGNNILTMNEGPPDTEFLGYMDREPTAVQECDWKDAKKYEILTTVQTQTRENLSVIQVYEVHNLLTREESLMHTIVLPADINQTNYRQVIKPGEEEPFRCFRAVHRDIAGNESPSSDTICWDG